MKPECFKPCRHSLKFNDDDSTLIPISTQSQQVDGTFNTIPILYRNSTLYSSVECVGESFTPDSWMYRSCLYRNLCFDVESNNFVVVPSPSHKLLEQVKDPTQHYVSSSFNTTLSLGGFVSKWGDRGMPRLMWSPRVVDGTHFMNEGYYELTNNTILIPMHVMAGQNIGHFVWDSLLPVYTLLSIFGLTPDTQRSHHQLVLMKLMLEGRPLQFSCRRKFQEGCRQNFQRLLPMIGVDPSTFSTNQDYVLKVKDEGERKSRYVCSALGAAGIGFLTDHGVANHGKRIEDYQRPHNVGRGPVLWGFRNFVLQNMGLSHLPTRVSSAPPIRVTFSIHSSGRAHRNFDFQRQIDALQEAFALSTSNVIVKAYQFSKLSMSKEIEIITSSHVLITICGGGAMSSMFLPRGASLILYYSHELEGIENAKLDYDYLSNMGYTKTHWLSTQDMDSDSSLNCDSVECGSLDSIDGNDIMTVT